MNRRVPGSPVGKRCGAAFFSLVFQTVSFCLRDGDVGDVADTTGRRNFFWMRQIATLRDKKGGRQPAREWALQAGTIR